MLDAALATDVAAKAFVAEMAAKARPRRASTRRADELDNLSEPGAQRLCQMIKRYWSAAGFSSVETEIVSCTGTGEKPVYGVRSNLKSGLPPTVGGHSGHG
jgi:hypothetical protein